jgi:hypothetical protein
MSTMCSGVELEIGDVKLRKSGAVGEWFASAHVVAIDTAGRKAEGWVHVVTSGASLKIENFDEYDDTDPELLGFVVATQGDAIIAAVKARVAAVATAS